MDRFEEKTIIVNGQAVRFYHLPGTNSFLPSLVFLHGWRSESRVWLPAIKSLARDGYDIYLIDLPGFGASENPRTPFSVGDYAEVVRVIIERLGILNVVLVGHSFGGRIGIKLAVSHPSTVEKIVLVDAAGVRLPSKSLVFRKVVAKCLKPFFEALPLSSLRTFIYRKMGAEDYISTPELKDTFKKVISEDLEPLLPKVNVPTLIIWGDKDVATTLAEGRIMEERISDSKLIVLEGAGHYSFLDMPRQFADAINTFVKK